MILAGSADQLFSSSGSTSSTQLATMALRATLKSVTNHYIYAEWLGGVCRRVSRNG
jgi:hypothetical protein